MANVKLGDRTYANAAIVRLNSPDGTVVDFYESNFYDIDVTTKLGNIVENESSFSEYDITEVLTKEQFYHVLEQRMIPRLLIFRDGGYIDIILLDRITSTVYANGATDWTADGDLGVFGEAEYAHFNICAKSDSVYLNCYRSERKTQPEPISPYYLIDLASSIDKIFETNDYYKKNSYTLQENEIAIPEIIQAIGMGQDIRIKFWENSYTQMTVTLTNIKQYKKTASEEVYTLSGFYKDGEKRIQLYFQNTDITAQLEFSPVWAQGAVYSIDGVLPDENGEVHLIEDIVSALDAINGEEV